MTEALPCIVCNVRLNRVDDHCDETQPYEGTNFHSQGHYGSTVFDPMDGSYVSFNICDTCLVERGQTGHVVCGRRSRPVLCRIPIGPGKWMESDIGYENVFNSALVPWTRDLESFDEDDVLRIGLEDIEAGLGRNVHIRIDLDALVNDLREARDE